MSKKAAYRCLRWLTLYHKFFHLKHVRSCLHFHVSLTYFCLGRIFVPWLAGVILFSCLVGDCVILSEATRVYRQLKSSKVILAWKYRESVLVEFSRYYLTLCSCVVDTGVSWFLNTQLRWILMEPFTRKCIIAQLAHLMVTGTSSKQYCALLLKKQFRFCTLTRFTVSKRNTSFSLEIWMTPL